MQGGISGAGGKQLPTQGRASGQNAGPTGQVQLGADAAGGLGDLRKAGVPGQAE